MSHSPSAYVPGAVVRYAGPTDTRCSQWIATIARGTTAADKVRASVPYNDGPDAAVAVAVRRFNAKLDADWRVLGPALSLDGGTTYAYPVGVSL